MRGFQISLYTGNQMWVKKNIICNDCQWLHSILGLPNLTSLFSGVVLFRFLTKTRESLSLTQKSKCLSQVSFLCKKDSLFKNLLFYFCHIPRKNPTSCFWKAFWPTKKKRTSLIHRPPIHQWCPLIRGSTVIFNKENPSQHYNHMN